MYKERRDLLPWYVKLYIYLRRNIINPILLLNDRNRIKNMNLEASKGEVSIKSSIEQAIINDLKQEFASGEKTTFQVETHIKPKKMLLKYLKLMQQIFWSNLDAIVYFLMIYNSILKPGLLTIVYPISIFGYALLEETRPKK